VDLREAVKLVWADVAEGVYRDPTPAEAVHYAREAMTVQELQYRLDDQRDGAYDEGQEVVGDVYGAYVDVRTASEADLLPVIEELTRLA
jgi:hypothetical protein